MTAVADVHVCDINDDITGDRKRKNDKNASDPDRTTSAKNVRCGNISFGVSRSGIRNSIYFSNFSSMFLSPNFFFQFEF